MQEWYLLTPPSALGGYENELLDEYDDSFLELLQSDIADDLELYKNDMSDPRIIRGIVQKTIQDTKNESLNRMVLMPIGTAKAGMYIKYKGRFWLILNLMDDNHVYEKAIMIFCNHLLTWENDAGQIIQRWANISSASQYNNGLAGSIYFTLRSDQLIMYLSDDFESLILETGKRFFADKRCELYEKRCTAEEIAALDIKWITYELTRIDNILFNYTDSGYAEYLIVQDELHSDDGYFIINGKGYWLCDYSPTVDDNKNEILSQWKIKCESTNLFANITKQRFYAQLYDVNGDLVRDMPTYRWDINCDFQDKLKIHIESDYIEIFADNSLIGKSINLTLTGNESYENDSININIVGFC